MSIQKGALVKLTPAFYKYFRHLSNRDFIKAVYQVKIDNYLDGVDLYFKSNTIKNQYLKREEFVLNSKPYKKEDWI